MGIGNTAMRCTVPSCDQLVHAYGFCARHCGHFVRHGHPTIKKPKICTPCCVVGCGKFAYAGTRTAQPLCNSHQTMFRRYGRTARTKPRKHDDDAGHRVCSNCRADKPNDQFAKRNPRTPGGSMFASECRVCVAAYKRKRRAEQGATPRIESRKRAAEKAQQRQIEVDRRKRERDASAEARRQRPTLRCRRCGEERPRSDFWAEGHCKSCEKEVFKSRVDALDEKYVRRLMAKRSTVLKGSDIPASLVQAKQMQLKIMRYLNNPRGEQ